MTSNELKAVWPAFTFMASYSVCNIITAVMDRCHNPSKQYNYVWFLSCYSLTNRNLRQCYVMCLKDFFLLPFVAIIKKKSLLFFFNHMCISDFNYMMWMFASEKSFACLSLKRNYWKVIGIGLLKSWNGLNKSFEHGFVKVKGSIMSILKKKEQADFHCQNELYFRL